MKAYISISERRFDPKYHCRVAPIKVKETEVEEVESYVGINNIIQKRLVKKKVDLGEEMLKYRVSDYSIENLMVVGALDGLARTTLAAPTLTNADHLDSITETITDEVVQTVVENNIDKTE